MQLKFRIILNVKDDVLRDIIVDSLLQFFEFSNIISELNLDLIHLKYLHFIKQMITGNNLKKLKFLK